MREFIKDSLAVTGIFLFLFVFGGTLAVYSADGRLAFDYARIMQILGRNVQYILVAILLSLIALIGVYRYFRYLMKLRRNCQVQYVDLETIANTWLEYNEAEDVDTQQPEQGDGPSKHETARFDISMYLLDLKTEQTKEFYKQVVMPIMDDLSETEKKIVLHLLVLLDSYGHVQSVASMFENDPEKIAYGKKITLDGKTSYQILKEYSLLDHTLRVARNAMNMIKGNQDGTYRLLRGQILIAALAHDIGKLRVEDVGIKDEIYRQNPHEQVSVMIMQALYPDYEHAKTVYGAVRSHHIAKPSGKLAYLLKKADHEARDEEIRMWMVAHKADGKDPNSVPLPSEPVKNENENPEKRTEGARRRTEKVQKTAPQSSTDGSEPSFLAMYGEELRTELISKVNRVEKDDITNEMKIVSAGFGDTVLFEYQAFKKTVERIRKKRADKEMMLSIVREMKEQGIVKMVNTEKGYFVSKFRVEDRTCETDMSFVPVSCEYLGFSEEQIELDKRENPYLRNVRISSYNMRQQRLSLEAEGTEQ